MSAPLRLVGDEQLFAGRVSSRIPAPLPSRPSAPAGSGAAARGGSGRPEGGRPNQAFGPYAAGAKLWLGGKPVTVLLSLAGDTLVRGERGGFSWVATEDLR